MRIARRISQLLFLFFYLLLFVMASYPLENGQGVSFFLKLDSIGALSAAIAARSIAALSVASALALIVALIGGRFFCGWVCPLGTTLDYTDKLSASRRQKKANQKRQFSFVKYIILISVITAALFSLQIAGFFAPLSLLTRSLTLFLYPVFAFIIDQILAFFYNVGFLENWAFYLDEKLRGTLIPVSQSYFYGGLFHGALFLIILSAGVWQRRFWCRTVCPMGALLGLISKLRVYQRRVSAACTQCGLCAKECRMGAIPLDYGATLSSECINCMDCQAICPVQAISFGFSRKKKTRTAPDFTKRQFISAGITGLLLPGILKTHFSSKIEKGYKIRPPGAMPENQFLDRCLRCGECVKICSTSGKGLQLSGLEYGVENMFTPILKTPEGYCEYNCNLCGQVCPTQAIRPLPLIEKQEIKMGTAHFNKTRCIPWYYGEDCLVCEEHCPLPEKAIQFVESEVQSIDGQLNRILLPYVDESKCIGCGICTSVCPVEGEKGIYLNNADEQRAG